MCDVLLILAFMGRFMSLIVCGCSQKHLMYLNWAVNPSNQQYTCLTIRKPFKTNTVAISIKGKRPNDYGSDCLPLKVYSSMEHLSQLEQKATTSVSRREHKSSREDKVIKRESLGSFSMRDKSWRTGSPEMWVEGSAAWRGLKVMSICFVWHWKTKVFLVLEIYKRVLRIWFPGVFFSNQPVLRIVSLFA